MGALRFALGGIVLIFVLFIVGMCEKLSAQTICHRFDPFGTMCFPLVAPPDADTNGPPGVYLVHDGYSKWMRPDVPRSSCCNNQDCSPVEGRYDEKRKVYQALIDGEWRDIPPQKILDPRKPENRNPDGSYHACWNRSTGELYCFREAEPKI